jgi:GMP synthase (glutamine-hydrolysing)
VLTGAITSSGHTFEVVRLDQGEPIPAAGRLEAMAGLVVLGGPMSVHDGETYPWLAPERAVMAGAVASGLPVLGICLGAQQLAAALGAAVGPGPAPEVGMGEVHLTKEANDDPVFGPAVTPLPCMHWHADTFDLPDGSTLLARNEAYANQAFVVGEAAYGLQFHVEVTASLVAHWGPHLPPGVFVRAPDIAHISRSGEGLLRRFVALADR